jgi:hypothetical protein
MDNGNVQTLITTGEGFSTHDTRIGPLLAEVF